MEQLIRDTFLPVKTHAKNQAATYERFGSPATPTVIIADPDGTERHRFEGYLPPEEFLAQLQLGLARQRGTQQG